MSAAPRLYKKSPGVRLGMQALCITHKGTNLTRAELQALQDACDKARDEALTNSTVALLRVAALDVIGAHPLTDEHIGALRVALTGFVAPKRDAQSVKPAYDWQKRKDMA